MVIGKAPVDGLAAPFSFLPWLPRDTTASLKVQPSITADAMLAGVVFPPFTSVALSSSPFLWFSFRAFFSNGPVKVLFFTLTVAPWIPTRFQLIPYF